MLIEQILYMNLDRRPDRNAWFLENMETAGVPMEIVERIPAKNWRDYDSAEDIIKAVQKDGFGLNIDLSYIQTPMGDLGVIWSSAIALRQIVEDDKITLLIHDDFCLTDWGELADKTACFFNMNMLQIVNLQYVERDNEYITIYLDKRYNDDWFYGAAGGEGHLVFSPEGARRMLALVQGLDRLTPVEAMAYEHFNNLTNFHSAHYDRLIQHSPHQAVSDVAAGNNERILSC